MPIISIGLAGPKILWGPTILKGAYSPLRRVRRLIDGNKEKNSRAQSYSPDPYHSMPYPLEWAPIILWLVGPTMAL